MKLRISKSGQLELPRQLRDRYDLTNDSEVTIVPVGSGLIIGKNAARLEKLQQTVKKELIDRGVTLENMLKEQRKTRSAYNAETYGLSNF